MYRTEVGGRSALHCPGEKVVGPRTPIFIVGRDENLRPTIGLNGYFETTYELDTIPSSGGFGGIIRAQSVLSL